MLGWDPRLCLRRHNDPCHRQIDIAASCIAPCAMFLSAMLREKLAINQISDQCSAICDQWSKLKISRYNWHYILAFPPSHYWICSYLIKMSLFIAFPSASLLAVAAGRPSWPQAMVDDCNHCLSQPKERSSGGKRTIIISRLNYRFNPVELIYVT